MTTKGECALAIAQELSRTIGSDDETGERSVLVAKLNDVFLECESIEEHTGLADELLTSSPSFVAVLLQAVMEGDELVHVVLRALLNLSFSARGSQQIVAYGGAEALVAIMPLSHPAVQVLSLRVLRQLAADGERTTRRLCTRNCFRALLKLLANSQEAAATAADSDPKEKQLQNARRKMHADDGAWRLLVAHVLPLLDVLTRSSRFSTSLCSAQLCEALEAAEYRMNCACSPADEEASVQQLLRILSRVQRTLSKKVN
ncbi:hypothetical protein Gpo141_00001509 [Globisporangium polare]